MPRPEIVVSGMFLTGNRNRLEKQESVCVCMWRGGGVVCKTKWSVILLFLLPLTGEKDRVVLLARNRMSMHRLGIWGNAVAFQLCCRWGVILARAAKPSPACMSGTIIA